MLPLECGRCLLGGGNGGVDGCHTSDLNYVLQGGESLYCWPKLSKAKKTSVVCVEGDPDAAKEGTGGMLEDDAVGPVGSLGSHACELSAELSCWIFSHGEWEERRSGASSPRLSHGNSGHQQHIHRLWKVPRNRCQALSRLQG